MVFVYVYIKFIIILFESTLSATNIPKHFVKHFREIRLGANISGSVER